jgi:hypothetical protein
MLVLLCLLGTAAAHVCRSIEGGSGHAWQGDMHCSCMHKKVRIIPWVYTGDLVSGTVDYCNGTFL